jgi:chemotaxis protein methyltransferase CheR
MKKTDFVPSLPTMTQREFERFSALIYDEAGIKIPQVKKTMLEARLQKRIKAHKMRSFEEYADFVFSPAGQQQELVHLVDVVTTNKTDFFREPQHFDFLVKQVLPYIEQGRDYRSLRTPFKIWSAGCSTGEEPYTMAMVLHEYAQANPGFRFAITASDICTRVLKTAMTAVYPEERVDTIPLALKKKYLLRSKDKDKALVRICRELRQSVSFQRVNLMDDELAITDVQDAIFCRNVIIYFDKPTQTRMIHKFHRRLAPGGFLFLGHSETLNGLDVPFQSVGSTVYRRL